MLKKLLQNIIKEQDHLDKIIEKYLAANWSFNRIDIVILSILRAATGEILYCPETPEKVIFKEYISIAEEFVNQEEIKFINAVLDKIGHNKNNHFS
jgi:N utilization substance protein B